jgi:ubiquinone/menaquinone biosynthesis C-methylase UbiE
VSSSITTIRELSVSEAHSLWAESYDRSPNPLLALEERIVQPLLPALEEMLTLDVACGTGRWLAKMLHRGARFGVGFDFSPEMLKEAQRKPSLHDRLIRADCGAIPLRSDTVDLAMCSFGVSYVPDLHRFARELSIIVRKRGHLFLSDFNPSAHLQGWKRTFRHNGTIVEVSSFRYSIADICRVFAGEGFELISRIEPCFEEAERHIFEEAGKGHLLDPLLRVPAIFVCHFLRTR